MRVGRRVLRHSDSSSGCISCKCKFPCQVRQRLSVTTRFPRFNRLVPRRKSAYGTFRASFAILEWRLWKIIRSVHLGASGNSQTTCAKKRTPLRSKADRRRVDIEDAICYSRCTPGTLYGRSSGMVLREFRAGISKDSLRSYIRPEWRRRLPGDYCNCEWTALRYFREHWYSSRSTQL